MSELTHTVGQFEIVRRIARGGMGVVYLARQPSLDRDVALKEFATFTEEDDPSLAERFLREARLAAGLSHSNIVTVYDYFEHEGTPFIAMEYMEHGSVRPLIGQLRLAQIANVLEALLAGLACAEEHGVVHRDLKPENLLVTTDGTVKIADFGIAKAYKEVSMGLTATGMALGTPTYMAPEQVLGREVSPQTDLYATGVIAYEFFTGQVPFPLGEAPPIAVLWQHVNVPLPPPRSLRPDLDPRLAAWLEALLAKDPEERPAGAQVARRELEEIVVDLLDWRWRQDARLVGGGEHREAPPPVLPTRPRPKRPAPTRDKVTPPAHEPVPWTAPKPREDASLDRISAGVWALVLAGAIMLALGVVYPWDTRGKSWTDFKFGQQENTGLLTALSPIALVVGALAALALAQRARSRALAAGLLVGFGVTGAVKHFAVVVHVIGGRDTQSDTVAVFAGVVAGAFLLVAAGALLARSAQAQHDPTAYGSRALVRALLVAASLLIVVAALTRFNGGGLDPDRFGRTIVPDEGWFVLDPFIGALTALCIAALLGRQHRLVNAGILLALGIESTTLWLRYLGVPIVESDDVASPAAGGVIGLTAAVLILGSGGLASRRAREALFAPDRPTRVEGT